jgi:uroporphyrinogen decarboxylase
VDVSYQVVEKELMTRDDYDVILKKGWPNFQKELLATRIQNNIPKEYLLENQAPVDSQKAWAEIGVPVLSGGDIAPPFEYLCGGRSLTHFLGTL